VSQPERPQPTDSFGFTEAEKLNERITTDRLRSLVRDEQTQVHRVELTTNTYGEFLFVTVSRPGEMQRTSLTFWGLGYHEHRERWLLDEWNWYQSHLDAERGKELLEKQEFEWLLQERHSEIAPYASEPTQTRRGELFELLADLTDEDGAWAELDDLENLLGDAFWEE